MEGNECDHITARTAHVVSTVAAVVENITERTAHVVRASGGHPTVQRVFEGWGHSFAVEVPEGTNAAVMPPAQLFSLVSANPGPLVPGAAEAFERLAAHLYEPAVKPPVKPPVQSMTANC